MSRFMTKLSIRESFFFVRRHPFDPRTLTLTANMTLCSVSVMNIRIIFHQGMNVVREGSSESQFKLVSLSSFDMTQVWN